MNDEGKPVDLVTLNGFKHDGIHYAVGDKLTAVPAALALELTGAGRTRLATEADAAPEKAPKKPAAA